MSPLFINQNEEIRKFLKGLDEFLEGKALEEGLLQNNIINMQKAVVEISDAIPKEDIDLGDFDITKNDEKLAVYQHLVYGYLYLVQHTLELILVREVTEEGSSIVPPKEMNALSHFYNTLNVYRKNVVQGTNEGNGICDMSTMLLLLKYIGFFKHQIDKEMADFLDRFTPEKGFSLEDVASLNDLLIKLTDKPSMTDLNDYNTFYEKLNNIADIANNLAKAKSRITDINLEENEFIKNRQRLSDILKNITATGSDITFKDNGSDSDVLLSVINALSSSTTNKTEKLQKKRDNPTKQDILDKKALAADVDNFYYALVDLYETISGAVRVYIRTKDRVDGVNVKPNINPNSFKDESYGIKKDLQTNKIELQIGGKFVEFGPFYNIVPTGTTNKGLIENGYINMGNFMSMFDKAKETQKMLNLVFFTYGFSGSGKCLSVDTPVVMYDGTVKKIQNIREGELVMGDDSTPRTVLSTTSGQDEMYEILNEKGDSYTVNGEHILCLRYTPNNRINVRKGSSSVQVRWYNSKKHKLEFKSFKCDENGDKTKAMQEAKDFLKKVRQEKYSTISVKEYLKLPQGMQNNLKTFYTGVDFKENKVPLEPYFLGVWLGGGTAVRNDITTIEEPVVKYMEDFAPKHNCVLKKLPDKPTFKFISNDPQTNEITRTLRSLNLLDNKHIPYIYKCNSRKNRLELLAGLIDTDGYYSENGYEIVQKRDDLAKDIIYLVKSLGFSCVSTKREKSCMYKGDKHCGICNVMNITGKGLDEIPTRCIQQQGKVGRQIKDALVSGITVIPKGVDEYYGFTLDGNHQFVLGNFIVTHNSYTLFNKDENNPDNQGIMYLMKGIFSEKGYTFEFEDYCKIYGYLEGGQFQPQMKRNLSNPNKISEYRKDIASFINSEIDVSTLPKTSNYDKTTFVNSLKRNDFIKPTPNNPQSSRGFLIMWFVVSYAGKPVGKVGFVDMAGNEDPYDLLIKLSPTLNWPSQENEDRCFMMDLPKNGLDYGTVDLVCGLLQTQIFKLICSSVNFLSKLFRIKGPASATALDKSLKTMMIDLKKIYDAAGKQFVLKCDKYKSLTEELNVANQNSVAQVITTIINFAVLDNLNWISKEAGILKDKQMQNAIQSLYIGTDNGERQWNNSFFYIQGINSRTNDKEVVDMSVVIKDFSSTSTRKLIQYAIRKRLEENEDKFDKATGLLTIHPNTRQAMARSGGPLKSTIKSDLINLVNALNRKGVSDADLLRMCESLLYTLINEEKDSSNKEKTSQIKTILEYASLAKYSLTLKDGTNDTDYSPILKIPVFIGFKTLEVTEEMIKTHLEKKLLLGVPGLSIPKSSVFKSFDESTVRILNQCKDYLKTYFTATTRDITIENTEYPFPQDYLLRIIQEGFFINQANAELVEFLRQKKEGDIVTNEESCDIQKSDFYFDNYNKFNDITKVLSKKYGKTCKTYTGLVEVLKEKFEEGATAKYIMLCNVRREEDIKFRNGAFDTLKLVEHLKST